MHRVTIPSFILLRLYCKSEIDDRYGRRGQIGQLVPIRVFAVAAVSRRDLNRQDNSSIIVEWITSRPQIGLGCGSRNDRSLRMQCPAIVAPITGIVVVERKAIIRLISDG